MTNCFCGASVSFENCCEPYIKGSKNAPTAETLMRSRYSAFAIGAADGGGACIKLVEAVSPPV